MHPFSYCLSGDVIGYQKLLVQEVDTCYGIVTVLDSLPTKSQNGGRKQVTFSEKYTQHVFDRIAHENGTGFYRTDFEDNQICATSIEQT